MLLPTSTSAMSIERISNAVPESKPFARTALVIKSGFSRTALWLSADPIALTMASPTRAMTVLFGRATDKLRDVGPDRNACLCLELDTVLRDRIDGRFAKIGVGGSRSPSGIRLC